MSRLRVAEALQGRHESKTKERSDCSIVDELDEQAVFDSNRNKNLANIIVNEALPPTHHPPCDA